MDNDTYNNTNNNINNNNNNINIAIIGGTKGLGEAIAKFLKKKKLKEVKPPTKLILILQLVDVTSILVKRKQKN